MGSSTWCRCARSTAACAVPTPSTTILEAASASLSFIPFPIASPRRRFRLCRLIAVAMRSPIPASPENVEAWAPSASPRRAISTRPRVRSAPFVESPKPNPSQMPAAIATTFLSAAAISTPTTSSLV